MWCPKLHTVLEVRPHQPREEQDNPFPQPDSSAAPDEPQGTADPFSSYGSLLTLIHLAIDQSPQSFCGAALQSLIPQSVHKSRYTIQYLLLLNFIYSLFSMGKSTPVSVALQFLQLWKFYDVIITLELQMKYSKKCIPDTLSETAMICMYLYFSYCMKTWDSLVMN